MTTHNEALDPQTGGKTRCECAGECLAHLTAESLQQELKSCALQTRSPVYLALSLLNLCGDIQLCKRIQAGTPAKVSSLHVYPADAKQGKDGYLVADLVGTEVAETLKPEWYLPSLIDDSRS